MQGGSALEKWVSEGLQGTFERLFGLIIHSGGPLSVRGEYAGPTPLPTADQGVLHLQNIFSPLVLFLATLGILLAAIRLLWTRRLDPMMDLVRGLLTVIVATFGGLALVYAFTNFGNALSTMVMRSVTFQHGGEERNFLYAATEVYPSIIRVGSDLGDLGFGGNEPARQAITLLIGLAVMIGLITQMVILSLLEAVVYLIACLLPLAAATTLIPGVQVFSKVIGWLFACLLYKPLLLMIYLAGLVILGTDPSSGADLPRYLMASAIMLLATGALPVLMRLMSSPALWMMALATGGVGSLLGGGGGGGGGGGESGGSSSGGAPEGVGGGTMGGPPSQSAAGANERADSLSRNLGEGDGGGTQGGPPSGAADRGGTPGTQNPGTGDAGGGGTGGTGGWDPGVSSADGDPTASGAADSSGPDPSGSGDAGASGAADSTGSGSEQAYGTASGADGGGGGSSSGAVHGSSSGGGGSSGDGGSYGESVSYAGASSDGAIQEVGASPGGPGGSGGGGDSGGPGGAGGADAPDGANGGVV